MGGSRRPVLIVQADSFNRSRIGSVLCVPFTTNPRLADAPGNVYLDAAESLLPRDSVVVVSQLTCIDRARLVEQAGTLGPQNLAEVEAGAAHTCSATLRSALRSHSFSSSIVVAASAFSKYSSNTGSLLFMG